MIVSSKYPNLVRVRAVKLCDGFTVHVKFTNGVERNINLEPYLHGPVFEPIRNDPKMFCKIYIDHGALAWPNGADIDTDTLYYEGPPPWAEEHEQLKKTIKRRIRHVAPKRVRRRKMPVRA